LPALSNSQAAAEVKLMQLNGTGSSTRDNSDQRTEKMRRLCNISILRVTTCFLVALLFVTIAFDGAHAQELSRIDRGRGLSMLKNIKSKLKKDYYDETFGGMDIDARFATAEEKIREAKTLAEMFGAIAQAVMDLNDSHTRFSPPRRSAIIDYGIEMQVVGDNCFVVNIADDSDAKKKGIAIGDRIEKINGFPVTRSELWKMIYYYYTLNPQQSLSLSTIKPGGTAKDIIIDAHVTQLKQVVDLTRDTDLNEAQREGDRLNGLYKHKFRDVGGITIWKMPSFSFDPNDVPRFVKQFKNKSAVIIDLRGNPGGYVVTLEKLVGYFFEEDLKIADLKGRKELDPMEAKGQKDDAFKGKVIVLIDAGSASAAEIFSRLMQLERRGVVLGDISSGKVMMSRSFSLDAGSSTMVSYGGSITEADVIMSDGASLEHLGVMPHVKILPTGDDLANRRDPVLAAALELLGYKISPKDAGGLFEPEPYFRRKSNIAINITYF
jgi:carboxyl-terminal processing protease